MSVYAFPCDAFAESLTPALYNHQAAPSLAAELGDLELATKEHAARQGSHCGHGLGRWQQLPLACSHLTPAQ